jgi:hypothetical protein
MAREHCRHGTLLRASNKVTIDNLFLSSRARWVIRWRMTFAAEGSAVNLESASGHGASSFKFLKVA